MLFTCHSSSLPRKYRSRPVPLVPDPVNSFQFWSFQGKGFAEPPDIDRLFWRDVEKVKVLERSKHVDDRALPLGHEVQKRFKGWIATVNFLGEPFVGDPFACKSLLHDVFLLDEEEADARVRQEVPCMKGELADEDKKAPGIILCIGCIARVRASGGIDAGQSHGTKRLMKAPGFFKNFGKGGL